MSNKYYQAGKQAYEYMKKNGMKGTKTEIIDVLNKKGVEISEMREKMLDAMNNPIISTILKTVGAPVEKIKNTLNCFENQRAGTSSIKNGSLSSRLKNL